MTMTLSCDKGTNNDNDYDNNYDNDYVYDNVLKEIYFDLTRINHNLGML